MFGPEASKPETSMKAKKMPSKNRPYQSTLDPVAYEKLREVFRETDYPSKERRKKLAEELKAVRTQMQSERKRFMELMKQAEEMLAAEAAGHSSGVVAKEQLAAEVEDINRSESPSSAVPDHQQPQTIVPVSDTPRGACSL